jgi:hypothetical protein
MRASRTTLALYSHMWADPSMLGLRADWSTLAFSNPELDVFSALIKKTPANWFVRANINRATIGEAPITTAPTFAPVGDPGTLSLAFTPGTPGTLNVYATTPPGATEAVVIQATPGLSQGIATLSHQQRKILTVNPGTAGPWNIYPAYLARFGTPRASSQVFVRVWYVDKPQGRKGLTGQTSIIW